MALPGDLSQPVTDPTTEALKHRNDERERQLERRQLELMEAERRIEIANGRIAALSEDVSRLRAELDIARRKIAEFGKPTVTVHAANDRISALEADLKRSHSQVTELSRRCDEVTRVASRHSAEYNEVAAALVTMTLTVCAQERELKGLIGVALRAENAEARAERLEAEARDWKADK